MGTMYRKAYLDRFGRDALLLTADDIVDELPDGYRWAMEDETENWTEHAQDMVQVRRGGTDDEPWTDLAIKYDCMIVFGMGHNHDPEACEIAMLSRFDPNGF